MRDLTLQEQVLLLCLNDETGKYDCPYLGYGLAGAALVALVQGGQALLQEGVIRPGEAGSTGDDVLDVAVARIKTHPHTHTLAEWARALYRHPETPVEVLTARLIVRGILTDRQGRILWIFPTHRYPTVDPAPEHDLKERVRAALLGSGPVPPEVAALAPLLHACGVLDLLLTGDELKGASARIDEVLAADPVAAQVGKALSGVILEDQAAASVAVLAAGSTTTIAALT